MTQLTKNVDPNDLFDDVAMVARNALDLAEQQMADVAAAREEKAQLLRLLRDWTAEAFPDLDADAFVDALDQIVTAQCELGRARDLDAVMDAFTGALNVAAVRGPASAGPQTNGTDG